MFRIPHPCCLPRQHRIAAAALGLLGACDALAAERPEVLWSAQQVVFWAEADTGAVHAVGIRHGVSEFGVLRAAQRRSVIGLSLDPAHAVLTVRGDDAVYRYDARTLRPLSRETLSLARAPQVSRRWQE